MGCENPREHKAAWVIECFRHNHSAFNGYRMTFSNYSRVRCTECNGLWRTKAKYVMGLPYSEDYGEVHA